MLKNVDGTITNQKGLTLATTNADCILFLLYDPVKKVIAKAITPEQGCVLEKIGAEVVYPEKEMAIRLAKRLVSPKTMEYISLSEEIDITEILLSEKVNNITVAGLNIRKEFGLNIIAVKHNDSIITEITPDTVLYTNDNIVVIGKRVKVNGNSVCRQRALNGIFWCLFARRAFFPG